MCQDLISRNNKVSMEVTTPIRIRTRTRAKAGVITKIIRSMDGGIIRIACHHPK